MKAREVYDGSDGAVTKQYYLDLQKRGPEGIVALNLMRAQKTSSRAKRYRGGVPGKGSYRGMAYDTKQWAMQNLCSVLMRYCRELGIEWGWGPDPALPYTPHVLYLELPGIGQVSFHSPTRGDGPNYGKLWDGSHASEERILRYCDRVYHAPDPRQMELLA